MFFKHFVTFVLLKETGTSCCFLISRYHMPNFSAGSKPVNPCKFRIVFVLDKVIIKFGESQIN
jgi:hypothetical protein